MKNKKFQFEYILKKIHENEKKLYSVENNLQYIKVLKALKLWLFRLSMFQNNYEYKKYFLDGVFSVWDRVNNSILDYNYGNRPF